jgi:hypothetical protein
MDCTHTYNKVVAVYVCFIDALRSVTRFAAVATILIHQSINMLVYDNVTIFTTFNGYPLNNYVHCGS